MEVSQGRSVACWKKVERCFSRAEERGSGAYLYCALVLPIPEELQSLVSHTFDRFNGLQKGSRWNFTRLPLASTSASSDRCRGTPRPLHYSRDLENAYCAAATAGGGGGCRAGPRGHARAARQDTLQLAMTSRCPALLSPPPIWQDYSTDDDDDGFGRHHRTTTTRTATSSRARGRRRPRHGTLAEAAPTTRTPRPGTGGTV